MLYYPNTSYYDAAAGQQIPTLMDAVGLDLAASYNLDAVTAPRIGPWKDWMVFQLVRTISDEVAPDGRVRGFLRYDTKIGSRERSLRQAYPGYILGIDDRYSQENGGMSWSYQTCAFHEDTIAVRHSAYHWRKRRLRTWPFDCRRDRKGPCWDASSRERFIERLDCYNTITSVGD